MQLVEEYLKRHLIETPIVLHKKNSVVFLNNREHTKRVFSVVQIFGKDRLEKYRISQFCPAKGAGLVLETRSVVLEWDEYEDFILEWCKDYKKEEIVHGSFEVAIYAWEMFLYIYDKWLSKYANLNDVFLSLDSSLSKQDRLIYLHRVVSSFNDATPVKMAWNDMERIIDNYAYWLVRLVN